MLPTSKSVFVKAFHILKSSSLMLILFSIIVLSVISTGSIPVAATSLPNDLTTTHITEVNSVLAPLAPTITVTKDDAILIDNDSDTQVDPGDSITYTVVITNTGPDPATGVVFTDTIDVNTTLVPGSVKTTPLARNDSYMALGNVRISHPAISGLLTNDNDPDGGTVTVTAFDAVSVQGGNVVVSADGSFSYDPPAGYEGTDTFNYTITDDEGDTNSDTVTITINGMIWFINNNAAACTTAGCGRLSNPFSTLAAFNALNNGTGNNPASADNIFIYESGTGYSGAVTLLTGQKLIGQDATAPLTTITGLTPPVNSDPLPTMNSGNATETSLTNTITLNTNVTVRGLRIDSTTSTGMNDPVAAITGVSVSEVKVVTTTGTGVNFTSTGGTLNFIQLTTSGGAGANLVGNAGGTFTFSTVSVSSGANPAFVATGGGTINVCDENPCNPGATGGLVNTLTSTTGTALNIANTTIGTNNLEFRSISATGAVNGIVLNTTGAGRLVVTGNGGNCTSAVTCTGGAIQNTTGDGLLLTNTTGASLTRLFVGGSMNHGINANGINGLTLTSAYITNSGNGDNEHGLNLVNVQGTITLDGTTFNNASEDLVHLENNNVNATFNVTNNSQFLHPAVVGGFANSAILLLPGGTSALTVSIQNSTFTNVRNAAAQIGANLLNSSGTQNFTFSNNTINITQPGRASGVTVSGQELTRTDITISGNNFSGAGGNGVISLDTNDTSTIRGLVSNNIISNPPGIGIFVAVDEAGRSDVTLDGNTITNAGGDGIQTVNFGGTGVSAMDMTITNNQVNGHSLNTAVNFVGGMSFTTFEDNSCIALRGNTVTGTPPSPTQCGGGPCVDYYLEELGGVGTMEEIPNTGATTASAAYVNSINDAGPVTIFGFIDLTNGAACNVTGLGALSLSDPVLAQEPVETEPQTVSATNAPTHVLNPSSTASVPLHLAKSDVIGSKNLTRLSPSHVNLAKSKGLNLSNTASILSGENINIVIGDLPPGKSITVRFNVDVNNPFPVAENPACNQATITGTNFTDVLSDDPDVGGTADPTCTTINIEADLSITKTDGAATEIPGTPITYTITASNAGPYPDPAATVADTFPVAITGVTWSCVSAGGATCAANGAGDINETVNLPVGGSVTFTASGTIDPAATGTLENTAEIAVSTGLTDPDPANNAATDSNTLTPQADLSITKADSADPVDANTGFNYTLAVTNNGPSTATSVSVEDTLPAGAAFVSASGTGWTCGEAAGVVTCTRLTLAPGAAPAITISVTAPAEGGNLSNTADVSSAVTDPVPGNNSDTETTTVTAVADLAISKSDSADPVNAGAAFSYTLDVSNNGPSTATSVTVVDTLPAGVGFVTASGTGWSCGEAAGVVTCTRPTLAVGAAPSITIDITAPAEGGNLSNTATVSAAENDPAAGNNSDTETTAVTAQADVSITKTDGQTTDIPGTGIVYTIVASNAGPSSAPSVTVADTFPAILTNVTWSCVGAGGGTCTANGTGNINDPANLPAGGSVTYTVNAIIAASATGTLSNTATAAVGGGVTDPTPGNNSATDTTTLTLQADLSITKTDGLTTANPGQSTTYTITVSNAGPSDAPGSTVADTFPAALTGVTWTCSGAGGGTCTVAGAGNINDSVNLPAGGSVTYSVSATIDAGASGVITNTATVAAPGGVTDPVPGNNSATDTTNLDGPPQITDLTVIPGTIDENDTVDLSVTFTDPDTQEAHEVVIDWGDGISETINLGIGTLTAVTDHQYLDDNPTGTPSDDYTVTVTVNEADGGTDSDTAVVTVNNVAPTLSGVGVSDVNENDTITLSGSITDPGTQDTFTLLVDWGDGDSDTYNYLAGTTSFDETHQYLDNGSYTISLTLTDDDTGSDSDTVSATVNNVAPTLSNVLITSVINENEVATLSGDITDPGTLDTFTLEVDWGDGITNTYSYPAGTTSFSETHLYADDDPTGTPSDIKSVSLTLMDNDGDSGSATAAVTVNNVAPDLFNLAATPLLIEENNTITVTGQISDASPLDTFVLSVDWGDGPDEMFNYPAGTTSFLITHTYADDTPSAQRVLLTDFDIELTLTDDDTGSDSETVTVQVDNVPPVLDNVTITDPTTEGDMAMLSGNIIEVSPADTFTLTVAWGDGVVDTYGYGAGTTGFSASHTFTDDNPTATPSDTYTATLTLVDDDGGTAVSVTSFTVNNAAPVVDAGTDMAGYPGSTITFNGSFTDAGSGDTHTIEWDFGDGITSSDSLTPTHVYTATGVYTATLTVTDDDTGVSSDEVVITIGGSQIFLPIVMSGFSSGPDLVVSSLTATGNSIEVVVTNQGNAAVTSDFWVDVYIDPDTVPTMVNQTWPLVGDQGLVWGVTGVTLNPGQSITLTINGTHYRSDLSSFTAPLAVGTPIYAQVDSANTGTTYGSVLENHESSGGVYNNITATTVQ